MPATRRCSGSAWSFRPGRRVRSSTCCIANLVKALDDPAIKKRFVDEGITPAPSASPEEFAAFVRTEAAKWAKVIKDNDIKGGD